MIRPPNVVQIRMRAVLALPVLILAGCWEGQDICTDSIRRKLQSPDGRFIAENFIRDCGATTGYVSHVRLYEAGRAPQFKGPFVATVDAFVDLEIEWVGSAQLIIRAPSGIKYFRRVSDQSGVQIVYEAAETEDGAHPL